MNHPTLTSPPILNFDILSRQLPELETKGVFMVPGHINEESLKFGPKILHIAVSLTKQPPPLYFFFDTKGGDMPTAWKIFNLITSYKGPTIGIVLGSACSAGFLILQACKYRFALPGATGHIHSVRVRSPIQAWNSDEIAHEQKYALKDTKTMIRVISKRSGVQVPKLTAMAKLDRSFQLTPDTHFVDDVLDLIPVLHPLPEKWLRRIEIDFPTRDT